MPHIQLIPGQTLTAAVLDMLGRPVAASGAALTGGLVGDVSFAVLPNIAPWLAGMLTLAAMVPVLVLLWRRPSRSRFLFAVVICALSSFVFGWHVHEKAVLVPLLPLTYAER